MVLLHKVKLIDFYILFYIKNIKMDEKNNDMHCISIRNNNYRVNIRNKQFKVSKTFTQLDKAKEFRDFKLLEYERSIEG
jgi:hypothetical protein